MMAPNLYRTAAMLMTPEEELIERYFDAFNRHDLEAVMACFHETAVIVGANGKRCEGRDAVRHSYESEFAAYSDAHCELRLCAGNRERGVAESLFHGTHFREGKIEAIGAEVMEIVESKIKEIRDYHRPMNAASGNDDHAAAPR